MEHTWVLEVLVKKFQQSMLIFMSCFRNLAIFQIKIYSVFSRKLRTNDFKKFTNYGYILLLQTKVRLY